MSFLSPASLHDLADGRLDASARAAAEAELAGADAATRAAWRFAVAWREQTRAAPLHPLPAPLADQLHGLFAEWRDHRATDLARKAASPAPAGWLRQLMASLLAASDPGDLALAGVRSAALAESSQQFTFEAEGFEIVLNACPRPGGTAFDLHGQIFGQADDRSAAGPGFAVQLIAAGRGLPPVAPDAFGEFLIPAVPAGACQLVLAGAALEILTPPFELKP